mmetsp:Transcript_11102/g.24464  ORF Transcript_11102/g.24464 Transcript_11102/m.24464 type:complete len:96 (-) Transcript_11102:593-880(-)
MTTKRMVYPASHTPAMMFQVQTKRIAAATTIPVRTKRIAYSVPSRRHAGNIMSTQDSDEDSGLINQNLSQLQRRLPSGGKKAGRGGASRNCPNSC